MQQFISKLNDQEKKIFNVTVLFILLACFDRLFLGPVLERLKTVDEEIAHQENSIVRDLRFLSYKNKITKESEAFSKYMVSRIPEEDDISTAFFSRMEKLANQSKVNLIKSNPAQTKKEKDFTEYYANIDCTGALSDVVTFMYAVNSGEDLFKIVQFSMTPKKGTFNEVNASMKIVKLIVSTDTQPPVAAASDKKN